MGRGRWRGCTLCFRGGEAEESLQRHTTTTRRRRESNRTPPPSSHGIGGGAVRTTSFMHFGRPRMRNGQEVDETNTTLLHAVNEEDDVEQQKQGEDKTRLEGNEQRDSLATARLRIFLVVCFYFFTSMSVVFLNKILMRTFNFTYPLVMTWFQLLVAMMCIVVWGHVGLSIPSIALMPPFSFDIQKAREIAPLSFVYVCMIACNNLCLKYVEVSFYQVARSLTICFNVFFTYFILNQSTSVRALGACGVVIFGFFLGAEGELRFSWAGVIYGVASSFFVALYSIFVKKVLPVVDNDQWRLMIYNTLLAMVFLFPLCFVWGEVGDLWVGVDFWDLPSFWFMMILTGLMGFLINISTFMQIKFTSPLTHNISGTGKACLQTILGLILFQNPVSLQGFSGTMVTIIGSGLYSYVRYEEMRANYGVLPTLRNRG